MSESTFTIINKGIAAMGSAGGSIQDEVLARIDRRLKLVQEGLRPRNFLPKILNGFKNLGKNMYKGFFGGFTIGALIRQSQVFTATAGSFFQIAGAMIDTILAPLAPAISKTITASATIGIKAARGVAKISGAVIGPILDQIPKLIEGIAYMIPKTLEFLFNIAKFIKDLVSIGSITGIIMFAIEKLWVGLQYAGTKVYQAVIQPLWDKFKAWWKRTLPGYLGGGGGKEEPIKHAERAIQATSDIAGMSTSDYTHQGVTYKATKVKSAFIQEPATAAEKVANLMTGAALVKDIYSGYHRGGEGSFGAGSIFDEKGGGAVGLKQAVRKITDAVNNPSAFKAELAGIVTDKQFKDMMNIAAGQQYADDDITRTKMLAEGSRNKFGFGGGDNFYFPN